jgi:hypothetical protein
MPFFNTVPGLVPLKIYSGSTLLTTNVNLINFTGSGVTTTVNAFNGLTVTIGGGTTVDTGSLLKTASFSNPNLTFTKGDGSTFNVNLTTLVPTSASYAATSSIATSASYASNGGVTQLLAGPNIVLSPISGLGQVTVTANLSGSTIFNTATGSYGSFYDTTTQTNPVANIPRSMSFNNTDITNGVSISGSTSPFNTYVKTQNAGVYNIQFSAQVEKTDSGTDEIVIWLRKNGIDLTDTATTITTTGNNAKYVAAWNWFVTSAANDYYQIIWISADTSMRLLAESISGTHPGIPSVILTVNRVDQFLSNTGSFSGSFNGNFTGSLFGTASYATQALSSSYALTSSYVLNAVSASFASTASYLNTLNQNLTFNGNLTLNGTASITYLNTVYETASVIYSSGSNQLGDATNDTQTLIGRTIVSGSFEVTGSLAVSSSQNSYFVGGGNVGIGTTTPNAKLDINGNTIITGSLTVITGSNIEFQVLDTGVRIGNIITDIHNVTGSLRLSGSITGSLFGTASYATNALSASYAATASVATSASYAPVIPPFPYTGSAQITGSLGVTGSLTVTGSTLISNGVQGANIAPLIVNNTIAYQSPFTQYIQYWQSAGVEKMSLRADGTLTVAGTLQSNTLRLVGTGTNTTTEHMIARNGQNGTGINLLSGNIIGFGTNSNERMRITSAGDVGIGTTSPRTAIDIYNYATPPIITVSSQKAFDNADTIIGGVQGIQHPTLTAPSTAIYFKSEAANAAQGKITFQTGTALGSISEKMVIGFNGNVGIGTTTPNAKLDVNGSTIISGSLLIRSGSNLTVGNGLISSSYNTSNTSVGGTPGWTTALRNTAFGISTQGSVTTQTDNTSVGYLSLLGGTQNTAVGAYASQFNTGTANTVMGYLALGNKVSDTSYNVAIGYAAMYNASGSGNQYNIGIGYNVLDTARGIANIGIGYRAGLLTTTGTYNVFLGYDAGVYNTTGTNNVAIGYTAGNKLANSSNNVLIGTSAGGSSGTVTMSSGNVAIGYNTLALISSSAGAYPNIAIGYRAGEGVTTGIFNLCLGYQSGLGIGSGTRNIYMGYSAGQVGASLDNNIGIGDSALILNVSGSRNIAIGAGALANAGAAGTGEKNVALGYQAGLLVTAGVRNVFIGNESGTSNGGDPAGSGSYNTFVGDETAVFYFPGSDVGNYNVGLGYGSFGRGETAGYIINPGNRNTGLGSSTLSKLSSSAAVRNTAVGSNSGNTITSGGNNTLLGAYSGYDLQIGSYNIFIGDSAGRSIISGSNNTIIGQFSSSLGAATSSLLLIGAGSTPRILINSSSIGYINGNIAIGSATTSSNTENTLSVYPPLAGGTGEGGQILFAASGGLYTSASMIDNYQNQLRILKGTNTGGSTTGYFTMNLDTGASQFLGPVTASAYSGLPNNYLYVTRNTDQTIGGGTWADQDIVFNNSVYSVGIPYAIGSGLASLTGGKVYRITARLAWSAAATYLLQYSCFDSVNMQIGPTVEIVQSTNGSNNISDGTLDFIYAPITNTDIKIRTTSATNALSGERIRGDLNTQFIIQQIA